MKTNFSARCKVNVFLIIECTKEHTLQFLLELNEEKGHIKSFKSMICSKGACEP